MVSKFNVESYIPIDYRTWILGDEARQGINIKRLNILTPQELKLWEASEQYHDARDDAGHAEVVTYFSTILLPYHFLNLPFFGYGVSVFLAFYPLRWQSPLF